VACASCGTENPASRIWVRRRLRREEIGLLWTIDRGEIVERIYDLRDGALVLRPDFFDIRGWPPGEPEKYTPLLEASFDRGGVVLGVFDGPRLVGAAVIDTRRLGPLRDLVQLSFLHVGQDQRRLELGTQLFEAAQAVAAELGAGGLYVSATPSENTVDFYQRRGCRVTAEPDPDLFALEPEDIHFECRFDRRRPDSIALERDRTT
jgi:predicted N-acetyltransferase YhbS